MTRADQIEFVTDLTQSVLSSVVESIKAGRTPESWDGHELRQLLADKFEHETTDMPRARMREYENDRIVNNI